MLLVAATDQKTQQQLNKKGVQKQQNKTKHGNLEEQQTKTNWNQTNWKSQIDLHQKFKFNNNKKLDTLRVNNKPPNNKWGAIKT